MAEYTKQAVRYHTTIQADKFQVSNGSGGYTDMLSFDSDGNLVVTLGGVSHTYAKKS